MQHNFNQPGLQQLAELNIIMPADKEDVLVHEPAL